jgi:vitamin K-dependent gamma-carboxylase-like protein
LISRIWKWARDAFLAPQPFWRLELLRILVPLAVLGFMSSRIVQAEDWLSTVGFVVPRLPGDWRQPFYLPPLAPTTAWALCAAMVVSGLALSLGALTRVASVVFAATLLWVALADRLSAFTVSKLGTVLVVALIFTPCGARWSVDSWLRRRRAGPVAAPLPERVGCGSVRFFQALVCVFYFSSGVAKTYGDWWNGPAAVIWTHLHDSYQTGFAYFFANLAPRWSWWAFQWVTLGYELGAPLWFLVPFTRPVALVYGVGMHLMIGLMFGPVIWFSLLMIVLLVACFAPAPLVEALRRRGWRRRAQPSAS